MSEPTENEAQSEASGALVRSLVRSATTASLATIDRATGFPYASLVSVATDSSGAPLLLLSRLARHTRNLMADPRASLLIEAARPEGDPLQASRVTVLGHLAQAQAATYRRRYLLRHPEADLYAGFADFSFYRLDVAGAHLVGGFGRIVDLGPQQVLIELEGCEDLIAAEDDIIAHMNADHADAVALYVQHATDQPAAPGQWRMAGIDPEGCDLVAPGRALRIVFSSPIRTPPDARRMLASLAAQARARRPED